jgi:hypothetical protein
MRVFAASRIALNRRSAASQPWGSGHHGRVTRYESWAERQVREAIERGEFDNLPGAGQPIPGLNGRDDADWWVRGLLEREQLPMPLPTSLALRKEVIGLPATLADVTDEQTARDIVEELNIRIRHSHRHRVDGPPVVVRTVDVEATLAEWRRNRRR